MATARRRAIHGQCWDWLAHCQYTVAGWDGKFDPQLLSQCGSTLNCLRRSVPEVHSHAAGTLSDQQTFFLSFFIAGRRTWCRSALYIFFTWDKSPDLALYYFFFYISHRSPVIVVSYLLVFNVLPNRFFRERDRFVLETSVSLREVYEFKGSPLIIIMIATTTTTITTTTRTTTMMMMMMVMIIIIIMITIVFLERLSIWNMLNCSEQVQAQKYQPHSFKTPNTACVQTIKILPFNTFFWMFWITYNCSKTLHRQNFLRWTDRERKALFTPSGMVSLWPLRTTQTDRLLTV